MKNSNQPAFSSFQPAGVGYDCSYHLGLTKREYFAIMVVQGQMTATDGGVYLDTEMAKEEMRLIAKNALFMADALLAELEKETDNQSTPQS
jgi:hypothetical protein